MMSKFFPVEELARDERFTPDHDARAHGRPAHASSARPSRQARNNNRLDAVAGPTPATPPAA